MVRIVYMYIYMSYEEEDTCMSHEEEDTCMSYEEEDTCVKHRGPYSEALEER